MVEETRREERRGTENSIENEKRDEKTREEQSREEQKTMLLRRSSFKRVSRSIAKTGFSNGCFTCMGTYL